MNQISPVYAIHRLVWIALMAALAAVGAMVSIPVMPFNPVPVSLQTFFVLLSGLVLGPRHGALAMALYLAAGCLGLPVFTGGKAGFAVLLGPTGGFAMAYIPAAALCGLAGMRGCADSHEELDYTGTDDERGRANDERGGAGAGRDPYQARGPRSLWFITAVCACATALDLLAGSLQLSMLMDISYSKALTLGALPFIPGDAAKCLAAAAVYRKLASMGLLR